MSVRGLDADGIYRFFIIAGGQELLRNLKAIMSGLIVIVYFSIPLRKMFWLIIRNFIILSTGR
jgi:hypothetical protein